jgi:TRAP-type C4-dicarboxylate transport system substrate-binding protein
VNGEFGDMRARELISALAFAATMCVSAQRCDAGELFLAHPFPSDSEVGMMAVEFANCVQTTIGVGVNVVPDAKFGYSQDTARAIAEGLIDFAVIPAWALDQIWPEVAGLDQPGQMSTLEDLLKLSTDTSFFGWINDDARHRLNASGERRGSLALMAIGWEFDSLVGSSSSLQSLAGKKFRIYGYEQETLTNALGATGVLLRYDEIIPAIEHGAIDAAVVESRVVIEGVRSGAIKELQWSPDFLPFYFPIVVLMNTSTVSAFGENLTSNIVQNCSKVTSSFTEKSLESTRKTAEEASAAGAKVLPFDEASRAVWREAFRQNLETAYEYEAVAERIRLLVKSGYN